MRSLKKKVVEQSISDRNNPYLTVVTHKGNSGLVCSCVEGVEFFFEFKEWANESLRGCLRSYSISEDQAFCILAGMDLEDLR
jgi:hypothetical protein